MILENLLRNQQVFPIVAHLLLLSFYNVCNAKMSKIIEEKLQEKV